ncbi:MAG: hypothetical protein R3C53_15440 [Pirellulaceae bacterium]
MADCTEKNASRAEKKGVRRAATFRRKLLEADFLRFCQLSTPGAKQPISAEQFDALHAKANDYIHSTEFCDSKAESRILGNQLLDLCEEEKSSKTRTIPSLPSYLVGLCEARLLTPGQERQLFQRMNYLRFRALKILQSGPRDVAKRRERFSQWDMERTEGLLRVADWHRDRIVQANMRLVISIVKKFVNPQSSFDDLLSDGIMALIRAW